MDWRFPQPSFSRLYQMDQERFKAYLGGDWAAVEQRMHSALSSDITLLNKANDNILAHGGKKLRPILSLLVAKACNAGAATEDSRRFAAAAELLHNATLLHDDVADCSTERRGVPTTSSIFGNNASVLLGDFWLVRAMEQILDADKSTNEVIRIFSKTLSDLAEGEMLQLQKAVQCDTSSEDYYRIIYSKTASLFEASCVSAAVSVGAPEEYVAAAREFGMKLGMAFQIKDDIMDYTAPDSLGKPALVDIKERKITLPLLGALVNVDAERNCAVRQMLATIGSNPGNASVIRDFVFDCGGIQYASESLDSFVSEAKRSLDVLPDSEAREYLKQLADYTAYREK